MKLLPFKSFILRDCNTARSRLMKDLKVFYARFTVTVSYDNSNPNSSFNFSKLGFFLLIIWKRST